MTLTLPNPSNMHISFPTRAEFVATSIPAPVLYVNAAGLMYERDATGTAATISDGSKWSPTLDNVTPDHFGAVGDGVTDDKTALEAMVAWGAVAGADPYLSEVANNTYPKPITYTGAGIYATSGEITLTGGNGGARFVNMTFKAIAGAWETAGGTSTTELENYRPHKSDFIFRATNNATFITFYGCTFECSNLCGGVALLAKSSAENCHIRHCAGGGVANLQGDVFVSRCQIYQWLMSDVEYYDPSAYTGVGVLTYDHSDMRVENSVIFWLHECVRFEGTNSHVWGCHIFNGCINYLIANRTTTSDDLADAMADYYPAITDQAAAKVYDFPERTYHAGMVLAGAKTNDYSINQTYFDNATVECYADRVHAHDTKWGHKTGSTFGTMPNYLFKFYCHTNGASPACSITNTQIQVETGSKTAIARFSAYDGKSWNLFYTTFEASEVNNPVSPNMDLWSLTAPHWHVSTGGMGIDPVVTYYAPASGSFIGFADTATTLDGSNFPLMVRFGAVGDNAHVRATEVVFKTQDGATEFARINDTGLQLPTLPPSSAADTGAAGTIAWDANYIYVCTATDTWKRIAVTTW